MARHSGTSCRPHVDVWMATVGFPYMDHVLVNDCDTAYSCFSAFSFLSDGHTLRVDIDHVSVVLVKNCDTVVRLRAVVVLLFFLIALWSTLIW